MYIKVISPVLSVTLQPALRHVINHDDERMSKVFPLLSGNIAKSLHVCKHLGCRFGGLTSLQSRPLQRWKVFHWTVSR